jgi:hypothetical protein
MSPFPTDDEIIRQLLREGATPTEAWVKFYKSRVAPQLPGCMDTESVFDDLAVELDLAVESPEDSIEIDEEEE